MHTHRFGKKLKLPSTIAIKHQIRKLMFEDSVEKAEAGAARAKHITARVSHHAAHLSHCVASLRASPAARARARHALASSQDLQAAQRAAMRSHASPRH